MQSMNVSWESAQLLEQAPKIQDLPKEILGKLQASSNGEYLDVLAGLALRTPFTSAVFTTHNHIFVEVCGRWLDQTGANHLLAFSALSRVVPVRPYLSVFAKAFLTARRNAVLETLLSSRAHALYDVPPETLTDLLLSIYRLLAFDNATFALFISPAQVQPLLGHKSRLVRYLAIRILCLYLHASDAALVDMVKNYIGDGEVHGQWEGKSIDYTFLSLWEEKRLKDLARQVKEIESARSAFLEREKTKIIDRIIQPSEFSASSAQLGHVLVPRLPPTGTDNGSFVMTESACKDITALAEGLNSGRPLVVTGLEGSGKTSIIRHAARMLGTGASMVTLHLNEQTDAKLLIGMHTSSKDTGSFTWQPGVLTRAVIDGRWVVIEDLDRAPAEILSTLLPLLQSRELFVPNWGKCIGAASGFKLIATVRTSENVRGEEIDPTSHLVGRNFWSRIALGSKTTAELAAIIKHKSPISHLHIPQMVAVYSALKRADTKSGFDARIVKPTGLRDLLRWSARVEGLLLATGVHTGNEPISEATKDGIFLEAVDCFAAAVPPGPSKVHIIEVIARELQVPKQRVKYCLHTRVPGCYESETVFSIGRVELFKSKDIPRAGISKPTTVKDPFAITDHVSQTLESIGAAVNRAEPCLLVGETGTGKTTAVQKLATALHKRLIVINLSQQSESGDLLGGYKPVKLRSLAIPMREEFDELLQLTFKSRTNHQLVGSLDRYIAKARWASTIQLWHKALESIQSHFDVVLADTRPDSEVPPSKKRKVRMTIYQQLKPRWDKFETDVQTFKKHLSSGAKGFAFSFVEGSIVKAARNGDWVLLDEINLASPDTLESLADLFCSEQDGGPSLLLSETGDIERIQAHTNFRIFGAMNPATDIGKRDLPPSIRSRLSELFIEAPDNDLKNLVPLVKAYLGKHIHIDVRLATDVAQLYLKIKNLAMDSSLADGSNQKVHFSLRTLTRTLTYVLDIALVYGLRRALLEGFCMSFLTCLNKESEILLRPIINEHILGSHKNQGAFLNQATQLPQDGRRYTQFRHYWVPQGTAPVEDHSHYVITPFIERNLLNLVRATSTRKFPVLLQGPTSSGKTSMIEHLAKVSGNKFVRINNHEHTDLQEYLGSYVSGSDGGLQYQEGLLVQALKEGSWIVLDELNLAPTDVLEALNRLLDDNRELFLPETQQVVRPHENFMLFATQNPPGLYGGRKILSRAFRNRFLELHFDDIPEDELETILRQRSQIAPSFCGKIVAVYKRLSILRQTRRVFEQRNSFATLRDLFRWALRDADDREQVAINGFLLLAERVRDAEQRKAVKRVIEDIFKVRIDEDEIYGSKSLVKSLGFPLAAPQGITWTKSMRRLYVLITRALKSHEPVLLVGETGSGKTTICQAIAETMRTKIHIVNAHQNMETGDLIGAQRPIRDKASAHIQLSRDLMTALTGAGLHGITPQTKLEGLIKHYETLLQETPEKVSGELRNKIEQGRTKANALFEWFDGSLVQAMRAGHHYLLDEISLADDSVLERLNSVLEPSRSLLLAEKGSNDAQVTASSDFQFLATMNPGGDYGKRELSPALRNRFTEIWVPTIAEEEEMLEIVEAKLPPSRVDLARPMITFAAWYASMSVVNAPSLSIRDLLAWATFVDTFPKAETSFLAFHGAAMVYLDAQGANPQARAFAVPVDSSTRIRASLQKLSELFHCDVMFEYNASPSLHWSSNQLQIGDFRLTRFSDITSEFQYSLEAPTTRLNTLKIVRALQLKKPILLEGSPGVGKTTLVSALAHAIGIPLTRINLSDQTDLMDLFGSDVPLEGDAAGHFGWRDAPFLRAMQNGEWVLLDEMNLASQAVLEGLNACLDHRGQIYVSELDHTFTRHPNFVVFAAQNPHSQGGGRKGLPASFVNRFTVAYAESFTPEDLQIICHELFPETHNDITHRLIRCLTGLNMLFLRNPRLEAHGGPWSMNLRDIYRWLQLLSFRDGLLPLCTPSQFVDLLIVQRFRSLEDRATVSKVLYESLDRIAPQRGCYHAHSPNVLQVGFAVVPRDKYYRPSLGFDRKTRKTSLQITVTILICIQMSWPCLLVGPSGSGKNTLIRQLASSVGAELLNISLNPEMDTLDLIGGFEQLDTERKITAFVKRVQAYTQRLIIQDFVSASTANVIQLLELNARVTANVTDIFKPLQIAAQSYPSTEYPKFLQECQILMQQSNVDSRAQFEWVDGILVEALKQGKWLLLDNANLCNASILDRLNSLLEPNGFLNINEHRNPDGSARVVKPHPSFRFFITMDPRHGELSRAMRNRLVEIFVPLASPSPPIDVFGLDVESTISRFQYFQALDWSRCDDIQFFHLMNICFQHLSFLDFKLCDRWQAQILQGLTNLSSSKHAMFQSIASMYQDLLFSKHDTVENIQNCYLTISNHLCPEKGLDGLQVSVRTLKRRKTCTDRPSSIIQTIHPLNNAIMIFGRTQIPAQLRHLGDLFDLLIELSFFKQKLVQVSNDISLNKVERRRSTGDSTMEHIANFLRETSSYLSDVLDSHDFSHVASSQGLLHFAKDVFTYLVDLSEVVHSTTLDEGIFQMYRGIGRSLAAHKVRSEQTNSPEHVLANELASKLNIFNADWELHSGLAMEVLWPSLKPPTATSIEHLETCLEIEGLADWFDILKWRSKSSIQEIGKLRESLVAVHASVNHPDIVTIEALENAKTTLRDAEQQAHCFGSNTGPWFRTQFKILTQFRFLEQDNRAEEEHKVLEMLADRPTKASMAFGSFTPGWSILSQIHHLTGGSHEESNMAVVRQTFPISMLHKLFDLGEAPLSSLNLLGYEINLISARTSKMCKIISSDPSSLMHRKLEEMRSMVVEAIKAHSQTEDLNAYVPNVDALYRCLVGSNVMERSDVTKSVLLNCSLSVFGSHPSMPESQYGRAMMQMAGDWIQFFAGLLLLYIPDKPLDPALGPLMEQDRYRKRLTERQTKLDALQAFEKVFSGQSSSYRIHLLQENVKSLGAKPEASTVLRPAVSGLTLLQVEFNKFLNSVVLRLPNLFTLEAAVRADAELQEELSLLKVNIENVSSRLSGDFRGYDDITKPVLAMLQGLDVGLSLAVLASAQKTKVDEAIAHVCNMTPFLGASPQYLLTQSFHGLQNISLSELDPRALFLESIALVRDVELGLTNGSLLTTLETFHSYYREWKIKIDQNQKENAVRSSLYRYRGSEESEELEKEDLVQVFQTYKSHTGHKISKGTPMQDPKLLAQHLSHLHRDIFGTCGHSTGKMLKMIDNASSQIARMWSEISQTSSSPVAAERLLPALILNLSKARHNLQHLSKERKLYNFYTDANIDEAQKIVTLVQKIQMRFHDLQQAWPEHATLEDVLRTSKELLSLRHTEPVARILTKAEQLHGFIYEWQMVARNEFTAIDVYDQLTTLLVSWRRLELSTWGRLLDMEDELCKGDSDAWWFIAYEVIIAAPMSLIDGQESSVVYSQQLYITLEEFLATTSVGQYIHRLDLLKCFEGHLNLLAKEHESLNVIRNSLTNFLQYHHHFINSVQQTLNAGRQKIEKDLKEVLLLASWKDANITALRDSAKRSHHKLFKLVRNYRALLAQPAESHLRLDIADPCKDIEVGIPTDSYATIAKIDPRALELCQQKLSGWSWKPARLKNPYATAETMFKLSHLPRTVIDAASYLNAFTSDLVESIQSLRNETPSRTTEENAMAIKQLKSRKRKLYSETLKAVRQMGFHSNLSADVLKNQNTNSAVLSDSPAFGLAAGKDLAQAEQYFHSFLHVMPDVREKATTHSEDLTHGEASRSAGYLESILSTIVKQRMLLADSIGNLAAFENVYTEITNLWAPGRHIIGQQDMITKRLEEEMCRVVRWLPSILDTGCIILEAHQKLGESDSSKALESLRHWQMTMSDLCEEIAGLPRLPEGVSSSRHIETMTHSQSKAEALQDELQKMEAEYPNLAFIFKQIQIWARYRGTDLNYETNESENLTLTDFDKLVTNAINSILVALQHMSEALEPAPTTLEDARWLFKADNLYSNRLRCLQTWEIGKRLNSAMAQIQHLDPSGSDTLELASAVCAATLPILQQYQNILKTAIAKYSNFHLSLCRLATVLAKSFSQIGQEGFCNPQEDPTSRNDSTEKLEGGTGLGEGEGVEDVSKDIQDDEDLSELAQKGRKGEEPELEDQENAVDMDHDEMIGETGGMSSESDGNASEDCDDIDVEDETGDVDGLDSGAVDEKLWDGKRGKNEKEKEDNTTRGQAENDQIRAAGADNEKAESDGAGDEERRREHDEDQSLIDGANESEEVGQEEIEKMDPYAQEEQHLDLPEGMDLDDENRSLGSKSESDEIANLSDIDTKEDVDGKGDPMDEDENPNPLQDETADKPKYENGKDLEQTKDDVEQSSRAGSPIDTEPEDEDTRYENQEGLLQDRTHEAGLDAHDVAPSEAQGVGQDMDLTQNTDQVQDNRTQGSKGAEGTFDEHNDAQAAAKDGKISETLADNQRGPSQDDVSQIKGQASQPFKKLGDALEEWRKLQRQIQDPSSPKRERQHADESRNAQNEEYEHQGHDEQEDGPQALGAASSEQARPLGDRDDGAAMEESRSFDSDSYDAEDATKEDLAMDSAEDFESGSRILEEQMKAGAFIGKDAWSEPQAHQPNDSLPDFPESVNELDHDLSLTHLLHPQENSQKTLEEAQRLWSHYEAITQDLSLFLTEQLRLILAPTQATKMRGDFRTGKRLNIKRIIPYIASDFKRDKIWMRRSIPSKRNYQIMLAVDDSKSMSESGSGQLAYQTLALVSKSLSILEVGEICVVGFGNDVFVAHPFDAPFSSEVGATVLQRFSFHQEGTHVAKLVARSTELFREARMKQSNSGQDLWQLELIISDGLCEDHEAIKRLVRQATEERIIIVFVIVDSLLQGHSIVDMNQAVFESEPASGETGFKMKRYLDGFPFTYYLVVGDVRELPRVLAQALRQWFAEVVES